MYNHKNSESGSKKNLYKVKRSGFFDPKKHERRVHLEISITIMYGRFDTKNHAPHVSYLS